MLDLQNNFKIISILKWKKQIQKIMEKKEVREFRNPHVQHVATIYKNKKNFSITKQIRASTSMDAKLCKMQKILHFTHFDQKNTNISEYKNVYKCSIAIVTVYMHGYCSTCIYYFIIFFLSLSLLSLVSLCFSHFFLSFVFASFSFSLLLLAPTLAVLVTSLIGFGQTVFITGTTGIKMKRLLNQS